MRAAGITWRDYDRFMQKYVKQIGDERLTKVPKDLDLKPYRDEQDDDLLLRMLNSVHAGTAPKGIHVRDLAEAILELRRHDTAGAQRTTAIRRDGHKPIHLKTATKNLIKSNLVRAAGKTLQMAHSGHRDRGEWCPLSAGKADILL